MRLILLVFLFSLQSFSQSTEKPGYILNQNSETISQETFLQQTKTGKYTWVIYETKDSLNVRLLLKEEYGKISPQKKQQLLNNLKEITGVDINDNQTIIINFSFEDDIPNQSHCLDIKISMKSYRKFFKNREEFAQMYISQQGFKYTKDFVFEDKDNVIRKLLFPFGSGCTSIIIKPDGRFYRQMGEHHQDKIPSKAKSDW